MLEERARDAALAMREYQAERVATLAKTARLRALRLANEAADAVHPKSTRQAEAPKRAKESRRDVPGC